MAKSITLILKTHQVLTLLKKINSSKESIEIASSFIEKLLLENEEESLSSVEKTLIEKSLIQFAEKNKRK